MIVNIRQIRNGEVLHSYEMNFKIKDEYADCGDGAYVLATIDHLLEEGVDCDIRYWSEFHVSFYGGYHFNYRILNEEDSVSAILDEDVILIDTIGDRWKLFVDKHFNLGFVGVAGDNLMSTWFFVRE